MAGIDIGFRAEEVGVSLGGFSWSCLSVCVDVAKSTDDINSLYVSFGRDL